MSTSNLPALNASLNLVSTIFISMGWYFIRHGAWRRHMMCMITAVASSACFLVGYIVYHARVGEKSSGYTGWIAAVYFPILAIRLHHGRVCVFDALQMVSPGNVMQAILPARDQPTQTCLRHVQSLAHGNDLMFDQPMRAAHSRNVYGDYCDIQ